jgi:hypothetical protein
MSANRHARRARIVVYTRDAKVPIVADDWDMDYGWNTIPLPPTIDDVWLIWDDTGDRKTGWIRASDVSHGEWGHA